MTTTSKGRYTTVAFWAGAGSLHLLRPHIYEPIVPPPLRRFKHQVVVISGVAELAGALAIIPGGTRHLARAWLLALLAAVFPANIYMAVCPQRFKRIPKPLLWARLPLQPVIAWLTWRGAQ
jgi:uncharacterized membrane protein